MRIFLFNLTPHECTIKTLSTIKTENKNVPYNKLLPSVASGVMPKCLNGIKFLQPSCAGKLGTRRVKVNKISLMTVYLFLFKFILLQKCFNFTSLIGDIMEIPECAALLQFQQV